MTHQDFIVWLVGFSNGIPENTPPTLEQWGLVKENLRSFYSNVKFPDFHSEILSKLSPEGKEMYLEELKQYKEWVDKTYHRCIA